MPRRIVLAVVLLAAAIPALPDSWSMPERETFDSANGQWRLVVIPKRLESQLAYFQDKVEGRVEAKGDNRARAELFRQTRGIWRLMKRWRLVNEAAPVSALVANDGTVVTFDNWHAMGHGDDVVVIYRPDGSLVRKLALSDLLDEEDIFQLRSSVSSIWWSGRHRIDEENRTVVLAVAAHKTEELPLSLETGTLLVEKRMLFPRPRITWEADDRPAGTCDGGYTLTAGALVAQAIKAESPEYPAVARKARIAGLVTVDFIVNDDGSVGEVTVVKPLPFGIDQAARDAVAKWKFRPIEGKKRCGRVKMTFDLAR